MDIVLSNNCENDVWSDDLQNECTWCQSSVLVNGINQIAVEEKKAREERQDGPSLPEVRVYDYLMSSHRASQAEVAAGNIIFVKFKIKYSISPI